MLNLCECMQRPEGLGIDQSVADIFRITFRIDLSLPILIQNLPLFLFKIYLHGG